MMILRISHTTDKIMFSADDFWHLKQVLIPAMGD